MKQTVETILEQKYKGPLFTKSLTTEVQDRDPTQVINDGKMQGFRFYDEVRTTDENQNDEIIRTNCSSWIYFGVRLSFEEVKAQYEFDSRYSILIAQMKEGNYQWACHTQDESLVIMDNKDQTFDEFMNEKEAKRLVLANSIS